MLLGTHTSGEEQNYLMVATVNLPKPETEIDVRKYDDEKGECGGFGGVNGKVEVKIKIPHDGEVNRARHMPQNPFVVATKSPTADVFVFDVSKHPSAPEPGAPCRPETRCKGHDDEGYGLCWNPHQEGHLLSGSDDHKLCLWDISSAGDEIDAVDVRTGHSDVVRAAVRTTVERAPPPPFAAAPRSVRARGGRAALGVAPVRFRASPLARYRAPLLALDRRRLLRVNARRAKEMDAA